MYYDTDLIITSTTMLLLTTSSILSVLAISWVEAQQPGSLTNNEVLDLPMEECEAGENCHKGELEVSVTLIHDLDLSVHICCD